MSFDNLPFNLFDCVLLAVLVAGILRGRKHGMSEELLGLIKWLAVVVVCAMLYDPMGHFVAQTSPFSLLASYLMVYTAGALIILSLFALVKRLLGGKLVGSDVFGRGEYYLGMGSGCVRYSCILLAGLALLNAREFTPAEVKAMERYQNDLYGSNFFPTWHTAQEIVFEKSLSGPLIKHFLGFLLIKPTPEEDKRYHQKEFTLP